VKLYNPESEPPVLLNAGDYVRYVSVNQQEYDEIQRKVQAGSYEIKIIITGGSELRE
ncbi:MAG TPA: allophanate hydrolase, partial [Clostridiales bacterium]|nr:allophanate hydrolase [Clostridiales bacterium]